MARLRFARLAVLALGVAGCIAPTNTRGLSARVVYRRIFGERGAYDSHAVERRGGDVASAQRLRVAVGLPAVGADSRVSAAAQFHAG
ncbi:MAG: hypothetical protein AUH85_02845 [Chloroflexi bacterium 13_1_40CM_4_68_4]|nr:MAG: hypothetical protein AUH85_02845 [Chloroflexi bacterium 13_1_40CM_4_68_4]